MKPGEGASGFHDTPLECTLTSAKYANVVLSSGTTRSKGSVRMTKERRGSVHDEDQVVALVRYGLEDFSYFPSEQCRILSQPPLVF